MSPGLIARPPGMFSVAGTTPMTRIGAPSSAIARIAHATAAPPAMSSFIRSMPSAGLIEMPPVSNVMPLPTRPSTGPRRRAGRLVPEDHQARRLAAAARDAEQQAHAELLDLLLVEDLDRDAAAARDRRAARVGELARRQRVARLVGELAREVAALAEQAAARDGGVDPRLALGDVSATSGSTIVQPAPARRPDRRSCSCPR